MPTNCVVDNVCAGTPPGVGPVKVGQKIIANITNLLDIHFNVEKHRRLESCQVAQICPVVVIAIDSSCHTCPSTQEKGWLIFLGISLFKMDYFIGIDLGNNKEKALMARLFPTKLVHHELLF